MTLHADFELTSRSEAFRVDDRGLAGGRDVRGAGAVAALAIDALGQRREIARLGALFTIRGRDLRIGVVAAHALVRDGTRGAGIIGAVVTGIRRPGSAVFGVPAERQLLKCSARGEVQVSSRMIAGAEHEIGGLLFDVGGVAIEADLPASLIDASVALDRREEGVGRIYQRRWQVGFD